MPIITISRGSYYHAKSIAEKLAVKLGYRCISRDKVIDSLAEFHLPEIKLVRNLKDTFSVLDRFPHGKKRFTAAIKSGVLENLVQGNVVYHGLVGHHFLPDLSNVLKIRIIANTEKRVADEMKRENISEEQARYILKNDDEERRKWGMFLYGIDIYDPQNYHVVINIDEISEDEAVALIADLANLSSFQETEASKALVADMALNANISAKLLDFPNAAVSVKNGKATVSLKAPEGQQDLIKERIEEMIAPIDMLKEYELRFDPYY